MVTRPLSQTRCRAAMLSTDLAVAIAFLGIAVLPIILSFAQERRALLASYHRAIAMEIVDGEMELLLAGEWQNYSPGTYTIAPPAQSRVNLPPGKLELIVTPQQLRLQWLPAQNGHGSHIVREAAHP